MKKSRFNGEQIIGFIRQAEATELQRDSRQTVQQLAAATGMAPTSFTRQPRGVEQLGGKQPRAIIYPRGVKIREFKHEQRIQIAFSCKGVECRELRPPGPVTQSTVNLAGRLRDEIMRRIGEKTFIDADYFPASPPSSSMGAVSASCWPIGCG